MYHTCVLHLLVLIFVIQVPLPFVHGELLQKHLRFPEVALNEGNDYDPSTGVFTCRVPGTYWFSAALAKVQTSPDNVECIIMVNDGHTDNILMRSANNGVGSAAFLLKKGDLVRVGRCHNQDKLVTAQPATHTYFSGVLIRPNA